MLGPLYFMNLYYTTGFCRVQVEQAAGDGERPAGDGHRQGPKEGHSRQEGQVWGHQPTRAEARTQGEGAQVKTAGVRARRPSMGTSTGRS